MSTFLYYLTTVSVFAVLFALALGLYTFLHGKTPNLSQKLMRWRVGLQFFAIAIIIGYAVLTRGA